MKITTGIVLLGSSLAFALTLGFAIPASVQAADQSKGAEKLMVNPIKTAQHCTMLQPDNTAAMSCPKCKTITTTYVDASKGAIREEKFTQKHLCAGCESTIRTEGRGKTAKDVVVHICKTCGADNAFCCVTKQGSAATKGMEKK